MNQIAMLEDRVKKFELVEEKYKRILKQLNNVQLEVEIQKRKVHEREKNIEELQKALDVSNKNLEKLFKENQAFASRQADWQKKEADNQNIIRTMTLQIKRLEESQVRKSSQATNVPIHPHNQNNQRSTTNEAKEDSLNNSGGSQSTQLRNAAPLGETVQLQILKKIQSENQENEKIVTQLKEIVESVKQENVALESRNRDLES